MVIKLQNRREREEERERGEGVGEGGKEERRDRGKEGGRLNQYRTQNITHPLHADISVCSIMETENPLEAWQQYGRQVLLLSSV